MNELFANIGIKLGSRIDNFSQQIDHTGCPALSVSDILVSECTELVGYTLCHNLTTHSYRRILV